MVTKQGIDIAAVLSAPGFGFGPIVLDGIQIRGIGRQIFQDKASLGNGVLRILALMETRIVHHDDRPSGYVGQQFPNYPGMKYIAIDSALKQSGCHQAAIAYGPDHIHAAPRLPVMCSPTSLSLGRIAIFSGHIMRKATFIQVNNRRASLFILRYFVLENLPLDRIGPGVAKRLFLRVTPRR